jgi:hypothetical protein|tara:strand:- start:317 stop:421 length:105 start_codon:yes stop_codon:yes gene_type:complete
MLAAIHLKSEIRQVKLQHTQMAISTGEKNIAFQE